MIRRLLTIAALISLACLTLGFTGRIFPLGDSLAVFRLPNIIISAVLMFALRNGKLLYGALGLVVFSGVSIAIHYPAQPIDPKNSLRLYQKNLLFHAPDRTALKADILEVDPDFITLQEVYIEGMTHTTLKFISALKTRYP